MTPANGVTVARMLGTPFLVLLVVQLGASWAAVLVWVALAGSDGVDGWLARRQGTTTSGAFLDPLADKVLVLGALGAIAAEGWVPWLPVALIALREVAMSAYRAKVGRQGISVPARPLGKAKTAVQDLAVGLILFPPVGIHHRWVGGDLLWAAVVLAGLSGAQYFLDSRRLPPTGPPPLPTPNRVVQAHAMEDASVDGLAGA